MATVAREYIARQGWGNVMVVQLPAEDARLGETGGRYDGPHADVACCPHQHGESIRAHIHHQHGEDRIVSRSFRSWLRRHLLTVSLESDAVLQLPQEAAAPQTRLVELPGRGVTRVWECAGPPGAPALMLIHGVTVTAELNWGQVFAPLSRHFRVIAMDLRGHGDGIRVGWRFRLEDCADDVAALAEVLAIDSFVTVGYSMGGMVAQLVYRRHSAVVSGLVLCATARNVLGSPAEKLAALALPSAAAAIRWNPLLQQVSAEILGLALLGPVDDPATSIRARAQLRRTPLGTALSAVQAVCEFTSHSWISQVSVPTAVVVTTRDHIVPVSRQRKLAAAIPGASIHEMDADHAVCITEPQVFAQILLQACWSVTPGEGAVTG